MTQITREDITKVIGEIYDDFDMFLDDVENSYEGNFECFCGIHESPSDSDVCIIDLERGLYLIWYKLTHVGRSLKTNIDGINELRRFIQEFYDERRNRE